MPDEIAVKDTSSIIQVRRIVARADQPSVFEKLTSLVTTGKLAFPKEVLKELERWANPETQDFPLEWARSNAPLASVHSVPLETVRAVLAEVPEILDPDKDGVEEADPYVLALAMRLQNEGYQVTILTEERKDRPDKMSMNTACGVLRIPCLPVETFLSRNGIWRRGG
ncbi:MAG: DUF4411 family protein [Nitrospirae bacterium]|nr:DUF4411 family protein [Nitrospirota bacterium]MDE3041578.1 DUF4411 family protein [Nitrospirota bacterium]MDE3050781.1 DUF4411 family protein [Nitrospirota bacterium]